MRRHARANRERILEAAEAVFGARGALGSTEEVARRANVGIATVFRHFPTKEALIEAALVRHFARLDHQASQLADELDPAEALRRMLTAMVETGATKLTLASQVTDAGAVPEPVRTAARALRATMGTVLERAQAAGAVDDSVTVDALYVLIGGLTQASAALPREPAALRGAVEIVCRGLRPGR